ncbi:nuclear transport factor 2 family protein [Methylobacterium sp. SyP6R]|uniref:nuclear transport factor 2 family protein n=1 Tax=Methylobacterium sp. SyP6R TaxID=2718876 RepID=UPI001F158ACA|nr:DUF4440 domain-containing protein [Methylobacterium sp. SyP6R]MCF4126515.1 DUF4440 domain-containing protein [Methylobacterium sp. SyP6R]
MRTASPSELDLVRALEERLHDPAIRSSQDKVAALLADDFLEFGRSGGAYGKDEVVRRLAAEQECERSELTAYGYELRTLSAGVVLLTYRTVRKVEGVPDMHTLRSSVWKLIDGNWQMAFHQGTPTVAEI